MYPFSDSGASSGIDLPTHSVDNQTGHLAQVSLQRPPQACVIRHPRGLARHNDDIDAGKLATVDPEYLAGQALQTVAINGSADLLFEIASPRRGERLLDWANRVKNRSAERLGRLNTRPKSV